MKKFVGSKKVLVDPAVDIVLKILQASVAARPDSSLLTSFLKQYQERGGLSKKQLEGLHGKASKIGGISPANLATLEAIILKKPTRYKSEKPVPPSEEKASPELASQINVLLEKFPAHKRVLYFKSKLANRQELGLKEIEELEKFAKLLLK